jgi:ferric-dicitrate binding protein FerR (iron transport regulator)
MSDRSEDGIERLLRATGRRPAPPPERSDRVREAVRTHWRAERHRITRRRLLWVGAAAAAALAVFVFLGRPAVGIAARVERAEPPGLLGGGDAIEAGATLSTEAGGRIALRLGSGHAVRLDRGTRVRILSDRAVALEGGALYVDSAGAEETLEIRTPFGDLRNVGTQFLVRLRDGTLRVHVREGTVAMTASGESVGVHAGQLLEVGEAGPTLRQATAREEWAWAGEIAPMLAIEGRSARDFLDWIAREQGLSVRFESAELARSASATTLQGSIEGMTLDQALDSVLPTCGMRHRVDGDVLHVGPVQ